MIVIRNNKIKDVKKIHVGDIFIGKCWLCESPCYEKRLQNGSNKHISYFAENDMPESALKKFIEGREADECG